MSSLSRGLKSQEGLIDLIKHLIPAIIAIALFQVIAIQIYYNNPLSNSKINFSLWSVSQAIGSFVLGYVSDKYCRKKILIATQVFGALAISNMLRVGYAETVTITLLGLTFSPSAVARAALVDNFPKESKVKIIGITFIAVFVPWCFYSKLVHIGIDWILIPSLTLLAVNLLFTLFVFEDRRDLMHHQPKASYFIEKNKKKAILTLFALLPAQTVFFLSDSFFEESSQNASLFTALGIGVLLGAIISIFYRKIPHVSLLTMCYGIGLIFTMLSVLSISVLELTNQSLTTQILLFSIFGGLYLPFVYDLVLSSVSQNYRGTTCGIIEVIISIAGFIGLGIILLFNPKEEKILLTMALLFLIATISQKRSEKHR